MKISYNYEELIGELKEDVSCGELALTDTIQVLRSDKSIADTGYRPIIDWYCSDRKVLESLRIDMLLDDEQEINEKKQLQEQFQKDKPFLEIISVADCLDEMEAWNKII